MDRAPGAVEAAKENARALASAGGEVRVFRQDARTAISALADQGMQFDVVYLDPPYESDLYEPCSPCSPKEPSSRRAAWWWLSTSTSVLFRRQ